MSRHFPLVLLLTVASPFVTLHSVLMSRWQAPLEPVEQVAPAQPQVPDFANIHPARERKAQFFDFVGQFVEQHNQEILTLRQQIENRALSEEEWQALAQDYRVKWTDVEDVRRKLLVKVDVIPLSLVLAQAALESAWGTSRFATHGNNFFGQWCHTPGCGIVPDRRLEGKSHEVQVFGSPYESVAAYINNLNSHPAYKAFRERRAEQRAQRVQLSGCYMAHGLTRYSEMGDSYVETVKKMIRANRLERDPAGHCTPLDIPAEIAAQPTDEPPSVQESPVPSGQPQELAAEESPPAA